MGYKEEFYNAWLPVAKRAAAALDIPASVILAQWAHESAYGQSDLAKRSGNVAGIKYVDSSIAYGKTGMYADYKHDQEKFLADYTRVMNLGYYKAVRDAVSVEDTVKALGASPYAETKYGGGKSIMSVISADGLTKYDTYDIVGDGTVIKNIPVTVPEGLAADKKWVGLAVIAAGLVMLGVLSGD